VRVLHVVEGNLPHLETWASIRARRVACAQLELGFEPRFLSVAPVHTEEHAAGADETLAAIPIERLAADPGTHAVEPAAWRERAMFFHRASRRVRRLVTREQFHLVHVYGGLTVALASLVGAHQAEVPVVYEPAPAEAGGDGLPTWALVGFDAVVTPSRERAERWTDRLGRRVLVHYLPDGLDVERLRDVPPLPEAPTLAVSPLFDAAPDAAWLQGSLSRLPDLKRRLHLWVASPALRDEIRVGWNWPADRVRTFAPSLDALGDALANATALVYAHRAPRGSAFEILEAAARGRPVVAARCPGLDELVRDRTSGRLVDMGDERALAAALDDVLGRAAEMGRSFRRDAVQSRNWLVIAEGYFEVYDQVRRQGPGGGTLNRWVDAALRRLPRVGAARRGSAS
jgi:glycosyltransferase involved in cell wall biosynthesis